MRLVIVADSGGDKALRSPGEMRGSYRISDQFGRIQSRKFIHLEPLLERLSAATRLSGLPEIGFGGRFVSHCCTRAGPPVCISKKHRVPEDFTLADGALYEGHLGAKCAKTVISGEKSHTAAPCADGISCASTSPICETERRKY